MLWNTSGEKAPRQWGVAQQWNCLCRGSLQCYWCLGEVACLGYWTAAAPVAVACAHLISGHCPKVHLGPQSQSDCSACWAGSCNDSLNRVVLSRRAHLASAKDHKKHVSF